MIWPLLIVAWFALSYGWLGWLSHKVKREDESSLPDAPGDFTPAQVTLYFRMKAQYGAALPDLPDTNSDDDYTQMRAW